MKKISLVMLIFLAGSSIQGEIKQYIEIDTALIPKHRFFYIERKYTGEFSFDGLPRPAQQTAVSFILTSLLADDKDWTIQVFYDDRAVEILGDTIFKWPAPHKEGDQYTGTFSFIPWMSGLHNIVFHIPMGKDYTHPMEIEDALSFDVMRFKDDSIEIKFDFMPRTDIAACVFILRLFSCYEDKSKYYADQDIILDFVFDTDGSLLFANNADVGNVSEYLSNPDYGDAIKRQVTRIIEYSSDGQLIDIKTEW